MSFHDIENPTGGMPMERVIDQPTPEQHLLERILSSVNMEQAWKRVRANKGAPGVDGITIEQFPDHTRSHWKTIRESLTTGSYKPLPVKGLLLFVGRDKKLSRRGPYAHHVKKFA